MKALNRIAVLGIIVLLTAACGQRELAEQAELTQNLQGIQLRNLQYGANGFSMESTEKSVKGAGAPEYRGEHSKPPVLVLLDKAIAEVGSANQFSFSAIGVGALTDAGAASCFFLKVKWRNSWKEAFQSQIYIPEGQSPQCHRSLIAPGSKIGGGVGYIIAGLKVSDGTYAGMVGAGAVGVGKSALAAIGVGAAGIISTEFSYAAGITWGQPVYIEIVNPAYL